MVLDTQSQDIAKYRRLNAEPTRISSFGDISTVSGTKILDPLEQLLHAEAPSLAIMSEAIIHWVAARYGLDEFVDAQKEFQNLTGRVFHDDSFYHQRMSYFLDYFTFIRPIHGGQRDNAEALTPYRYFMNSSYLASLAASPELCQRFADLASFHHSLFQVVKIAKNRMVLYDLYNKDRFDIKSDGEVVFQGFTSGSVLQGFLFIINGQAVISHGVLIHPPAVVRIIKRSLRLDKKGKQVEPVESMPVLSRLAKQNLALVRHRNLDAKKIYLQDPR